MTQHDFTETIFGGEDDAADVLEGVGQERVVVVEQGDERPARRGKPVVGGDHDVPVGRPLDDPDPGIGGRRLAQHREHRVQNRDVTKAA